MSNNALVQATCSLCGAVVEGRNEEFSQPLTCPVCNRPATFKIVLSDKQILDKGASIVSQGARSAGGLFKKAASFGFNKLKKRREHAKAEKALAVSLQKHLQSETASLARLDELQQQAQAIGSDLQEVSKGLPTETAAFFNRELARLGSSGACSEQTGKVLFQYLKCLSVEPGLSNHVVIRLNALREIEQIRSGQAKPILVANGLVVRNSEVVWHECLAAFVVRKRSDDAELHQGALYVTSMRLVFMSRTCPTEIELSHINAVEVDGDRLFLTGRSQGKSSEFVVSAADLTSEHIRQVIRVFHRHTDVGFEKGNSRHILPSVKTAVWQRDGGKCVQCGATDYLEFDHIIPFSKGGANTVQNLQLLCRRCNGAKSDKI